MHGVQKLQSIGPDVLLADDLFIEPKGFSMPTNGSLGCQSFLCRQGKSRATGSDDA
jgi:hypothetical protein